ncbi:MAG: transposase [Candidatus Poribacteria bacterium]|nr:transposase [Candidatus Poribacteria bacterium]
MAKRRRFTAEFKVKVVLEALSGETTQAEVCRRHNLWQYINYFRRYLSYFFNIAW